MENKIDLKKAVICGVISLIVLSLVFVFLNYREYRKYTDVFNMKINMVISNIKENYPEAKISDIIGILNGETDSRLREYGIDLTKDSAIAENDMHFAIFLMIEGIVFFGLFLSLSAIFLVYNHKKDKKLREITEYIEEINRGNYALDIEDNTEDELSILKNEVYKTTVMLKEVAENSMQDKVKLKDSLSDISHQLKTPLTSITIMLDNMQENKQMDMQTREGFIKDIKREIINLNFLVSSLLKLSKFDANTISFINKDEKVVDILKEAIKNVAGLCDLKDIEINITVNGTEEIYCDFKWQVEAITNILKNCVEHSYDNSKIDISYVQNNIYTKIEIRDYGVGIDEMDLPHIFERFYCVSNKVLGYRTNRLCLRGGSGSYKGKNSSSDSVGIGLALAKSIIKENNGYVDAVSKKRKRNDFCDKVL